VSPARPKIQRGGSRVSYWIAMWGDDPRVLAWEADNPTPPEWEGAPHSYAFRHMPKPDVPPRPRSGPKYPPEPENVGVWLKR
jgi:hypothetical protein